MSATLIAMGNYLYSLCGMYGLAAQYISGSGGSVAPATPVQPIPPLEFTVEDAATPITTGGDTLMLTQFIGYQLLFLRAGSTQYQYNDGTNTYYSWDSLTGLFQCFGAANQGEQFSLRPYK